MFSSRWLTDDVPGISRMFGRKLSSHARAIWAGVRPRRAAMLGDLRAAQDRVTAGEGRAKREERHEGNAPCRALLEHRQGAPVGQVHGILHARDVGDRQRVNQVLTGDVAEADAADQPVVARLNHRRELVIESLAGLGIVHEAQVDRGETGRLPGFAGCPRFPASAGPANRNGALRPTGPVARQPC